MSKKPTVLMILDGYGLNDRHDGNAVYEAKTPVMDGLMKDYPFVKGNASGLAVGLPDGQMGNSEVGHMNMGAGRIVYQELTRITKEIQDGDFFKNEALLAAMKNAKENNSAVHFMGLLSDGGVHSHNTHLYGLLEMAKREGVEKVYVHCFLDGRDTPPASGKEFVEALEAEMKKIGVGEIATVSGRYYAMDRDTNWDRVEKSYAALVYGEGVKAENAEKFIFGYTIINDFSARNLQTRHKQWYLGKSLDKLTSIGPCIVTKDEIGNVADLGIRSYVNGELRQNSNTGFMIQTIGGAIEELSEGMTLLAGTLIATGTPAGVGMGFNPPKFLKTGDKVICEIDKIGRLENTIGE